jgi:pimeloyl-ACP methyl ester carboxylesterase
MRMRLVLAAVLLGMLPAPAAAQLGFCGPSKRECALLTVPLDRSGSLPGSVTLNVERMRAEHPADPPVFVIAGGPGRSTTRAFPREELESLLGRVVGRRDVVVPDLRGTGDSGALKCPALQRGAGDAAAVTECAGALGSGRAFFTSADSVADLEELRSHLGYERLALLASGYGARVALQYAAAHPERVERVVLESPVGPGGEDAFERASFQATPRVLRDLCRRAACGRGTHDPAENLVRLVQRLQRAPLQGPVLTPNGQRVPATLSRANLYATLAAGDAVSGIRRRFPAAVRSALAGDDAPLLWLATQAAQKERTGAKRISAAANVATLCEETALPWAREAPPDERLAQATAAAEAEPPEAFAPFDAATAVGGELLRRCAQWPTAGRPAGAEGPLPDVPVLVLSGTQSVTAPIDEARRVAALFPRSSVLAAPGAGEEVLGDRGSECAAQAVRRFLRGRSVASRCPRLTVTPTRRDPTSLRSLAPQKHTRGRAGRTATAVRRTYAAALHALVDLHERAVLDFVFGNVFELRGFRFEMGGLRSGSVVLRPFDMRFRNFGYVPGVRVSGHLGTLPPEGRLQVRGPAAARGTLRVRRGVMRGRLDGRRVRAVLGPDLFQLAFDLEFSDLGPFASPAIASAKARLGP